MAETAPTHSCAHVNMCDHGALGTGGMETAAHAATGMVEHTVAGGGERTEKKCVCREHVSMSV